MRLDRTSWLDTAFAHLGVEPDQIHVDSIAVLLPGLRFGLRGRRTGEVWDAQADLGVEGGSLLGRFSPDFLELSSTAEL